MTWLKQKAAVDRLAARATEHKEHLADVRQSMHNWKQQTFGNVEALAWAFAAGVVVSATSGSSGDEGRGRGVLMKSLNATLLTWRLFGRPGIDEAQDAIVGDAAADVPPVSG